MNVSDWYVGNSETIWLRGVKDEVDGSYVDSGITLEATSILDPDGNEVQAAGGGDLAPLAFTPAADAATTGDWYAVAPADAQVQAGQRLTVTIEGGVPNDQSFRMHKTFHPLVRERGPQD